MNANRWEIMSKTTLKETFEWPKFHFQNVYDILMYKPTTFLFMYRKKKPTIVSSNLQHWFSQKKRTKHVCKHSHWRTYTDRRVVWAGVYKTWRYERSTLIQAIYRQNSNFICKGNNIPLETKNIPYKVFIFFIHLICIFGLILF